MSKVQYLLVDAAILPQVYRKVLDAKNFLRTGEAGSVSAAASMAGISRSAYYKYKDKIFEYAAQNENTATFAAALEDNAGVLSALMNELYCCGANVLSVNQSVPVSGVAEVTVTVQLAEPAHSAQEILKKIENISGVRKASLL